MKRIDTKFTDEELWEMANVTPSQSLEEDWQETLDRMYHKLVTAMQVDLHNKLNAMVNLRDKWIGEAIWYNNCDSITAGRMVDTAMTQKELEWRQQLEGHIKVLGSIRNRKRDISEFILRPKPVDKEHHINQAPPLQ